jgi:hypothetical protein
MNHLILLHNPDNICRLCNHVLHPLCNNGNCQDIPHNGYRRSLLMSYCQNSIGSNNEHCWEWWKEEQGLIWYRCLNANCGETMYQYIDTNGR